MKGNYKAFSTMDEGTLTRIALIASLTGMLILLFATEKISINSEEIALITEESLEQTVKVKGKVTQIKDTPAVGILTIEDNSGKIKVIAFKEDEELNIKKNNIIEVEGEVMQYQGKLEIEAKVIKVF